MAKRILELSFSIPQILLLLQVMCFTCEVWVQNNPFIKILKKNHFRLLLKLLFKIVLLYHIGEMLKKKFSI